jgi:uncharacterized RDD family membrane protein YckC
LPFQPFLLCVSFPPFLLFAPFQLFPFRLPIPPPIIPLLVSFPSTAAAHNEQSKNEHRNQ